jgi:murein hydrolase activator
MGSLFSDPPAWRRLGRAGAAVALVALLLRLPAAAGDERADRRAAMQEEIRRLRAEMESLGQREQGLLGEVARLGAVLSLREREAQEASLKLEEVRAGVAERQRRIAQIEAAQEARGRILGARLREIYKRGAEAELERLFGGETTEAYLQGLRYASFLSERDARILRGWREDGDRLRGETASMREEERRLDAARTEALRAAGDLERSRAERSRLLDAIATDRAKHREAIEDLERASRDLGRLVESLGGSVKGPSLDVRKFRGLLDWPAEGPVTSRFGNTIHPRFRTVVPHPGLDIDALEGGPFRAVFDGRVVFASWLHGYGLTAIVDHGHGVLSVYAHASILLAGAGDDVARGEALGRVGDTGSLRGPYLYFELREDGKPVDPGKWLRHR